MPMPFNSTNSEVFILEKKEIDMLELCDSNPELANSIVKNTSEYPHIYNKILFNIPLALYKDRPFKSSNINKIVAIKGTIIKTLPILLKNNKIEYNCLKCNFKGHCNDVGNKKSTSVICDSCGSSSVLQKECLMEAVKTQNIRIQDIGNISSLSEIYDVLLEGDFAGKFFPGEEVMIVGVLKMKWNTLKINEKIISSVYMHALGVYKLHAEDTLFGFHDEFSCLNEMSTFEKRRFLLECFGKDIIGYSNVKLGLLLALANECKSDNRHKNNTRQISHVLLVGNSGTGKSHFLKICSKLVSPSVFTNGIGTTNAGLTTCAVRQGKDWYLEAGALVLADLGICCIDEFNRLKVNEKGGLLESMEQQTLSIAKAGIVSSLNTRCSIIASCNINHTFDKRKSVSENTLISTPLVSRFDLIFGMFDTRNKEHDDLIADKILSRKSEGFEDEKSDNQLYWNASLLKKYLSIVRKRDLTMPEELTQVLLKYYSQRRSKEGPNEFNTIRMLESLVRLSESHAKLLGKTEVEEDDLYTAILLMETTISSLSTFSLKFHEVFLEKKLYVESVEHIKKIYNI